VPSDDIVIMPEEEEDEGIDEWILTYADLFTLLLVFFIMLFSMSEIDVKKFTDSFTSVKQALGEQDRITSTTRVEHEDAAVLDEVKLRKQLIESHRKVYSDIRTFLNQKGVEGIVGAVFDNGVVTLDIPGNVLFRPGQAELTPEGEKALAALKDVFLQYNDQSIDIRGFTHDQPPPAVSRFTDNWELSSLRAVNVLRFLMEQGIESTRLTATGLADLSPKMPNDTPENRARNERVEFNLDKNVTR